MPKPTINDKQVLVRISAAALNHRDLFIRQNVYHSISFDNALLADGCGTVVEIGSAVKRLELLNQKVLLAPMRNWDSDPMSPEGPERFTSIGGVPFTDAGTAQDYIAVSEDDVELAPEHLSMVEGAALPLAALTGWRTLVTKAGVTGPGKNILVTGIGGSVALIVLQFAVAFGCNVYVTSSSPTKIDKAIELGAKGGVSYKDKDWGRHLQEILPVERPFIDAVIDGAAGDIIAQMAKVLRPGGCIVQYGMTTGFAMNWNIQAVISNIELKGSTMGSRREFRDMVAFVAKHKITPIVHKSVCGLDNLEGIDGLFKEMIAEKQFGKLVIEIGQDEEEEETN